MAPVIKVALAQTSPRDSPEGEGVYESPVFSSLQANLTELAKVTKEAAASGAELVVFPEYCVQGIISDGRAYLGFPHKAIFEFIASVAKANNVAIAGSVCVDEPDESLKMPAYPDVSPFDHGEGKDTAEGLEAWTKWLSGYKPGGSKPVIRNRAFFIDHTGTMVGKYDKRNLWHPEREYLTAGEHKNAAFQTKWGKAGMMICWDMSHPAEAQELSNQGVDLIIAPTYWKAIDSEPYLSSVEHEADYELKLVQAYCFARAAETETVWIMCNPGGSEEDGFMGGSGVWQPLRGRVGGYDRAEVGIKRVDVDMAVLKVGREAYKIREDYCRMYGT